MRDIDTNIAGSSLKTTLLQSCLKLLRERWKGISVSVILVVATIGFTQIEVTGGTRQNVLESFYQAVRLFVLGADGTPADGAVTWIVIMWCAYLLAPALTATLLVESLGAIKQAVVNPDRVVRKMKNHLILCGLGKHGKLIVERVLARDAQQGVVIVDRDSSLPSFFEFAAGTKVPVIAGDMTDALTLGRAGIERSRRLYAASGNDVANLNTCLLALAKESKHTADFRAVALVSDVDLSRGVSEYARREGVVLINPYEIAARNLAMRIWTTKESPDLSASVVVVAPGSDDLVRCLLRH